LTRADGRTSFDPKNREGVDTVKQAQYNLLRCLREVCAWDFPSWYKTELCEGFNLDPHEVDSVINIYLRECGVLS
jgi:hypothetical protein